MNRRAASRIPRKRPPWKRGPRAAGTKGITKGDKSKFPMPAAAMGDDSGPEIGGTEGDKSNFGKCALLLVKPLLPKLDISPWLAAGRGQGRARRLIIEPKGRTEGDKSSFGGYTLLLVGPFFRNWTYPLGGPFCAPPRGFPERFTPVDRGKRVLRCQPSRVVIFWQGLDLRGRRSPWGA